MTYGEQFADAMAAYLTNNGLKQSQLTRTIMASVADHFHDSWKRRQKAKKDGLNEAEWLAQLQSHEANRGLDVQLEMQKCQLWIKIHPGIRFTRRRFLAWLLKADRPLLVPDKNSGRPPPSISNEVPGWKGILNHHFPDSLYADGGIWQASEWTHLSKETQQAISQIYRNEGCLTQN